MKRFLFLFLLAGLLTAPLSVQAQPAWKQLLKMLGRGCQSQRQAISDGLQKALRRRIVPPPATRLPPIQAFASLENVSVYYDRGYAQPPFPLPQQKTELYRGMTLDPTGRELRHIFKHGLEVSKTHTTNFGAYDGREYPRDQKAIFATPEIRVAASFAYGVQTDNHIPVIIHLKRVNDEYIVSIPHDVPLSWIYRVSALLKIDGRLVWGEIKLDENDRFIFTPYPAR